MRTKEITVSKGMTINLGNYSSHRVEVGITVSLDDVDDVETGVDQLAALVDRKLAAQVREVGKPSGTKRTTLMEERNAGE